MVSSPNPSRLLPLVLLVLGAPAQALPELRVVSVEPPATSSCDVRLDSSLRVVLENAGDVAAGPFDLLLFEDEDRDGLFGAASDEVLGQDRVPGIADGATVEVTVGVSGLLLFPGAPVMAFADASGEVAELDEGDNLGPSPPACGAVSTIEPSLEWQWSGGTVLSTPTVGDVDADGTPDVVFIVHQPSGGVVHVLSGLDGSELWTAAGTAPLDGLASVALADLDGDAGLEVVAPGRDDDRLHYFDDDGSELAESQPRLAEVGGSGGAPAIADLDCDGAPEVIFGPDAFTADGGWFWTPEPGGTRGSLAGFAEALVSVLDVDDDGTLEVIAGPTAYTWDALTGNGRILWSAPGVEDGFTAAGNFDDDPLPEIVVVTESAVWLLEGETGQVVWTVARDEPAGCDLHWSGAPTVADLDGDGWPEVGIAGLTCYVTYEHDGSIGWWTSTQDTSSGVTSSVAVDLNGDGRIEVAYHDQRGLHVYDGADGRELAFVAGSSGTWQELVTAADVDGDGELELLHPLSQIAPRVDDGVRVYGNATGGWASGSMQWNQHGWHLDNLLEDGGVPGPAEGCEQPSWLTHGSWRGQPSASASLPDLRPFVLDDRVEEVSPCNGERVLSVRVGNGGAANADAFTVTAHEGDPDAGAPLLASAPCGPLLPGQWCDVELRGVPQADLDTLLVVRADSDDNVRECVEDGDCETLPRAGIPPDLSRPGSVGDALRARDAGSPRAADITAVFEWPGDDGAPRGSDEHYHFLRGAAPTSLRLVGSAEPLADTLWLDSTPNRRLGWDIHYYRVVAATACEVESLR